MAYDLEKNVRTRQFLLIAGVSLLALATLLFLGCLFNFFDFNTFEVFGHTGLRSLAALAVFGCLLAAIGSWDD